MHELPYIEKLYELIQKEAIGENKMVHSLVVEMSRDLGLVPASLKSYWRDIRRSHPLLHKATLHLHTIPHALTCVACHHTTYVFEITQLPHCEKCKSMKLIEKEALIFRIHTITYFQ